eukprot:SAG31_NODE_2162_length_6294_cov_4.696691_4_plen_727_part_00
MSERNEGADGGANDDNEDELSRELKGDIAVEESVDLLAAASTSTGKGSKRGLGFVGKIKGFSIPTVKRSKTADSGEWYYLDQQGVQQGPYELHQIKQWHAEKYFPDTTSIKNGQDGDFHTLRSVVECDGDLGVLQVTKADDTEASKPGESTGDQYDPLEDSGASLVDDTLELPADIFDAPDGKPTYPWHQLPPKIKAAVIEQGYREEIWPYFTETEAQTAAMKASETPLAGPKSGVQWSVVSEGVPNLAPATTLEAAVEKAAAAKMHADREETVAAKARELHQAAEAALREQEFKTAQLAAEHKDCVSDTVAARAAAEARREEAEAAAAAAAAAVEEVKIHESREADAAARVAQQSKLSDEARDQAEILRAEALSAESSAKRALDAHRDHAEIVRKFELEAAAAAELAEREAVEAARKKAAAEAAQATAAAAAELEAARKKAAAEAAQATAAAAELAEREAAEAARKKAAAEAEEARATVAESPGSDHITFDSKVVTSDPSVVESSLQDKSIDLAIPHAMEDLEALQNQYASLNGTPAKGRWALDAKWLRSKIEKLGGTGSDRTGAMPPDAGSTTVSEAGANENIAATVVSSLDVSSLKVTELRSELQKRGLATTGNKAALSQRLTDAIVAADQQEVAADTAKIADMPVHTPAAEAVAADSPSSPSSEPAKSGQRKTAQMLLLDTWQKEAGAVTYAHGPPGDSVQLSASRTVVLAAFALATTRRCR